MIASAGYATPDAKSPLARIEFERRDVGPGDVLIDIEFCGVCHSDLHQVRDEWHNTVYPSLPGHEIVGRVAAVGAEVTVHVVGDRVGVGCMVDSCQECEPCREGEEQYCEGPKGWTATYNGPLKPDGTNTYGGYSKNIVVRQEFVVRIPEALEAAAAAPLLCAGVTTFSPLQTWAVEPGDKVGVVGMGGLGHVAVQLARAIGAQVVAFTTSPDKVEDAESFGADAVVISTDEEAMAEHELSFDFILSTVPTKHDVNPYIKLLKRDASLVMVGALEPLEPIDHSQVAFHRRSIAGSLIGGIAETQAVLDFAAENGIAAQVEVIPIDRINEAFDAMNAGDVRYRYVIDMSTLD
jgi:uncharacterized zinc-type alcohol dehydrogenase-like protein